MASSSSSSSSSSYLTQYTLILLIMVIVACILTIIDHYRRRYSNKETPKINQKNEQNGEDYGVEPPTPRKFPIIGHLHLLSGYQVPYQAFNELSKKYGNIYKLQLGTIKCVVVNGQKNIREALVTKGHHFDSRPNFERYRQLFCGNKENSLAFCDWSNTQKIRRDMLKTHTFPRSHTNKFNDLEDLISGGVCEILTKINENCIVDLKPIILRSCANIFINHFCTKSFDFNDEKFVKIVDNYDTIFYEVNQGYAADFLPFLLPFHRKNLQYINNLTHEIREFVQQEIIGNRYDIADDIEANDYVESLIKATKSQSDDLSWDAALFALEDIIGGHSAVGNFLIKLFAYLAKEPQIQNRIQQEIDQRLNGKPLTISDRNQLPYIEATIFEAIRLIASPIVPRVANRNSTINNYRIEEGSVIFLNNYDLSMSEELWTDPIRFQPERFIKDDNTLFKPEYFLPFGGGRRSCMGYKLVQLISFGILGGLLQNFTILPANGSDYCVPVGSLALPKDTFKFRFVRR